MLGALKAMGSSHKQSARGLGSCRLQWNMLQMKKDPRFKEKFPDVEEEEEPEITIRLKTGDRI